MFSRPKLQKCQIHIFATFPSPYSVGKGDVASPPPCEYAPLFRPIANKPYVKVIDCAMKY